MEPYIRKLQKSILEAEERCRARPARDGVTIDPATAGYRQGVLDGLREAYKLLGYDSLKRNSPLIAPRSPAPLSDDLPGSY